MGYISDAGLVALRKESVDRNSYRINGKVLFEDVALRKESVDRNKKVVEKSCEFEVALRKESVDRNDAARGRLDTVGKSLSARRAWIEIPLTVWL